MIVFQHRFDPVKELPKLGFCIYVLRGVYEKKRLVPVNRVPQLVCRDEYVTRYCFEFSSVWF